MFAKPMKTCENSLDMENGIIVHNLRTSEVGVTVWDPFGRGEADQESIVYNGTDDCVSVNRSQVEIIAGYDVNVASLEKCTERKSEKICKYLGKTATGPVCLRFSNKRNEIIFSGKNRKKISPIYLYPKCQDDLRDV